MPNPTIAQVNIEEVLRQVAIGYQDQAHIGDRIIPTIRVTNPTGKYFVFDTDSFLRIESQHRSPAGDFPVTEFTLSTDTYSVRQVAIAGRLAEEVIDANNSPLNLMQELTRKLRVDINRRLEDEIASLVFTASNYASGHTTTLSGTNQWNDATSDPIGNIITAKETVLSKVGVEPNKIVMGLPVYNQLIQHPDILDRIKYTERGIVTTEILRAVFGVEQVLVGTAKKNTAAEGATANNVDIWGKHCALLYTPAQPSLASISFAYKFVWSDYDFKASAYYDNERKAFVVDLRLAYDIKVTSNGAGYLIQNAVA